MVIFNEGELDPDPGLLNEPPMVLGREIPAKGPIPLGALAGGSVELDKRFCAEAEACISPWDEG